MKIQDEIFKKIRLLELNIKRNITEPFSGNYKSSFRGKGIEFDELKEYTEGDDIRDIDWNVTARTGKPFIRKYKETRELTTILLVDLSGSMFFGTQSELKRDLVLKLCSILAFSALKNNDRIGVIIFTNKVQKYIPPRKGRKHVLRILRALIVFPKNSDQTFYHDALNFFNKVHKRHSICFLISDLIDFESENLLKLTNKRNDLIICTIRDKFEETLPEGGLVRIQDGEGDEKCIINTSNPDFANLYKKHINTLEEKNKKLFQSINADFIHIWTGSDPYIELKKLFQRRMAKIGR